MGERTASSSESPGGWRDRLRLAVGTLTVVRVRPPQQLTREVAGGAMLLAPVAAAPLAVAAAAVLVVGAATQLPAMAVGALVLGVLALGTRGLHIDGLADTADGLASSYDRERALSVMRTGDVGPAGVATTVLVLLVQVACLGTLTSSGRGVDLASWVDASRPAAVVVVAALLSRSVLPLACARGVPSARRSGLGTTVAGTVSRAAAAVPIVTVAGLGALALIWADVAWWRAPVAALAALAVTAAVVLRCLRRIGGITGDVLGACVELSFAAALLALTAG